MKTQLNSKTDPIYYQAASTLPKLIRTKKISSVEVGQAHLDRIAEINPVARSSVRLNAKDDERPRSQSCLLNCI